MVDVRVRVQGLDLSDERWASQPVITDRGKRLVGPWELLRGTSFLPSIPNFERSPFKHPGQHGESRAQFSSITPRSYPVVVRVHAVDSDPSSPSFKQVPTSVGGRLRALQENVNELFFTAQLGGNSAKGLLEVTRQYSGDGEEYTAGMDVYGTEEPRYEGDYMYADYGFVFRNLAGTWTTEEVTVVQDVTTAITDIDLPVGTSPVWDMLVAIRPEPETGLEPGSEFLNDQGVGFRFPYRTNNRNWWVLDMDRRTAGVAGTGTQPNWGASLTNVRAISEIGRPQGSALLVNPGVVGSSGKIGRVTVKMSVPARLQFRYRPRYF